MHPQDMLHGPAHARCVIVNPVLGPETIAGSSRMKGGSATKIVLETLCALGMKLAFEGGVSGAPADLAATVRRCYLQYECTVRAVYSDPAATGGMVALITKAGAALNTPSPPLPPPAPPARFVSSTSRGRVLYVGVGAAGLLGLIDASECTPTYGSLFNDVRGFVAGGWAALRNKQGAVALAMPAHLRGDGGAGPPEEVALGLDGFTRDFAPTLSPADFVVALYVGEAGSADEVAEAAAALLDVAAALRLAVAAGAAVAHALVLPVSPSPPPAITAALAVIKDLAPDGVALALPRLALELEERGPAGTGEGAAVSAPPAVLGELALKLLLNATTTGAHILSGAIYTNRMVRVMLTNAKLFHRAVGIVADVTAAPHEAALAAVLRAIYRRDAAGDVGPHGAPGGGATLAALATAPVSRHVAAASTQKDVVPLAIMLALAAGAEPPLTVAGAQALLSAEPVVRRAITAALEIKSARDGGE